MLHHRIRHGGDRSLLRSRVESLEQRRLLSADLVAWQGFTDRSVELATGGYTFAVGGNGGNENYCDGDGGVAEVEVEVEVVVGGTGAPVIASLSDSPDPVTSGSAVTLTVGGVTAPAGAGISEVRFFRESNGTPGLQAGGDTLLGTDSAWSEPVTLVERHGRLALGSRLHVVGHNGTNLVHRSSTDDGTTWSAPTTISGAAGNVPMQYGGLYAAGDSLYLLTAAGDMGPSSQHLDFRKSTDNGMTWSSAVRITGAGQQIRRANIVVNGDNVHVLGGQSGAGGYGTGLFYFRSANGGATWSPGVELYDNADASARITVDGNTLHVAFGDKLAPNSFGGRTSYMRSADNGATWSAPVLIGGEGRQARQQIVAADGQVFAVWQREATVQGDPVPADRLGYNRSVDGGLTWLGPELLPQDSGVNREHQQTWLTPGGGLHLSWSHGDPGNPSSSNGYIFSPDYGATWQDREIAFDTPSSGNLPHNIIADGDWVHILAEPGAGTYVRRPVIPGSGPSPYTLSVPTAGLAAGTYTYYAVATATTGASSNVASTTNTVGGTPPAPGSVAGRKWDDADADGVMGGDEHGIYDWQVYLDTNGDGDLDPGEPSTRTNTSGMYSFTNLPPGTYRVREVLRDGWRQTAPATGVHVVTVASGQAVTGMNFGNTRRPYTTVAGRRVFYNHSLFDGNLSGANAQDDGAVAPDKSALLPGGTATFANYTSYSKGINGVMVDLANLPGGELEADDFEFRRGNGSDLAAWTAGPPPTSVTVRRGAGTGGTDRVTLMWPDYNPAAANPLAHAVARGWLQVTVKANPDTGLAAADVFYFGNAIGETGNLAAGATAAVVNSADVVRTRNNQLRPAGITSAFDFNRSGGRVNSADLVSARNNQVFALQLITPRVGATAPGAPASVRTAVPAHRHQVPPHTPRAIGATCEGEIAERRAGRSGGRGSARPARRPVSVRERAGCDSRAPPGVRRY